MTKINKQYILNKYNLGEERQEKTVENVLETFEPDIMFSKNTLYSDDFFKFFKDLEEKYKDKEIKIRKYSYGYDGGFEIKIIEDVIMKETDSAVMVRLKSFELKELAKERKLAKAKKLLKHSVKPPLSRGGYKRDILK